MSATIEDALRQMLIEYRRQELGGIQDYWSGTARDQGILTEIDLERYLARNAV